MNGDARIAAGIALVVACFASGRARADEGDVPSTIVGHPRDTPYWVGGQVNVITQYHPDFFAKYSGPNSLSATHEAATSLVISGYAAVTLTKTTEVFFDLESAMGDGLSSALGLAGFSNLDVVRNPALGPNPYVARFFVRQTIPLGGGWEDAPRTHLAALTRVPRYRLEISAGKLATADTFDVNEVGSDSHRQFMNWTVDNNGAYDYAADTRGYTIGAIAQLVTPNVALRFGEMLMPKVANGIDLDFRIDKSRGENLELELRGDAIADRHGAIRFLGFANHASMGSYREAIDAFLSGADPTPDITAHRADGRVKYGFGLNAEQELPGGVRFFLRAGWEEGHYESFAYTEVNDTFAIGGDMRGAWWWRPNDKVGLALVSNGLSEDHRRYLELGGRGFLLGDGALDYGREMILESYYDALLVRGVAAALDLQLVKDPGYNQDRGPVTIVSMRAHLEL